VSEKQLRGRVTVVVGGLLALGVMWPSARQVGAAPGSIGPWPAAAAPPASTFPSVADELRGTMGPGQLTGVLGLQSAPVAGCVRVEGAEPATLDCTVRVGQEFVQSLTAYAYVQENGQALTVDLTGIGLPSGSTLKRVDGYGNEVEGPLRGVGQVNGRFRFTPGSELVTAPGVPITVEFVAASPSISRQVRLRTRLFVLGGVGQTILGYKFEDANANGSRDAGEAGIGGWRIDLAGPGGLASSASTDASGRFAFAIAATGLYTVTEETRAGWLPTRPMAVPLYIGSLDPAEAPAQVLFGNTRTGGPSGMVANVGTDRGCREAGQNPVYRIGELIYVSFGVLGAAEAEVTLTNILADGRQQVLLNRRRVPGNQVFSYRGTISEPAGVEAVRLDAWPLGGGGAPGASSLCSYSVAAESGPDISVAPTSIDFGVVPTGGSVSKGVTVRNVGQRTLLVYQMSVQGGAGGPFGFVGPVSTSYALPPGAAYQFNVGFAPRVAGTFDDFLVVRSNDPDQSSVAIPLHGQTAGQEFDLTAMIEADRGCLEDGQAPLYFVGDPIQLRFRADARGFGQVLATIEDINAAGQTALLYRSVVPTNRDLGLGNLRVTPPLGIESVRLTAEAAADVWARDTCSFNVAAVATALVGYKFEDLNGNGVWEGNPATPWLPGNEPPVAGWAFTLSGPENRQVVTGADGRFEILVTAAGNYVLTEESRSGWRATTPTRAFVTVRLFPGEQLSTMLFGNQRTGAVPTLTPTPPAGTGTPPTPEATSTNGPATATPPVVACRVQVDQQPGTMNVGERADLGARVTGSSGPVSYQWTVDGDVLKDYSETTNRPWSITAMAPVDYRAQRIAFYWQPDASQRHPANGGPVARTVRVTATTAGGSCSDEIIVNVERNASSSARQAEDFYTTNHSGYVMREHTLWHQTHMHIGSGYDGALFFDFHDAFVGRLNQWRATFGYPPVPAWDPAGNIPRGPDTDHSPRNVVYVPQPKPSWFTVTGGPATRPWNRLPCDSSGGGERQLADFPADRRSLGCAVTEPWHNGVHAAVGGDMLNLNSSPRDPLFWRWHTYVGQVGAQRLGLGVGSPPQLVYQSPFRLFHHQLAFDTISLTFSESVTGVTADQLTVNGRPATQVTGSAAGPYVFTGFPTTLPGEAVVSLAAGRIKDVLEEPFAGSEWHHTIVPPDGDTDGDGLSNATEVSDQLTNPFRADTDGDAVADGAEVNTHHTDPRWPDTDNDRADDGCELQHGSNPLDPSDYPSQGCRSIHVFLPWTANTAELGPGTPPEFSMPPGMSPATFASGGPRVATQFNRPAAEPVACRVDGAR
jgi:hypothetical protein